MNHIEDTIKVCNLVERFINVDKNIDEIATTYAITNRLRRGDSLDQIILDHESTKMGDHSSTTVEEPAEPSLRSLAIVAGVFAGLYEDPTDGATRFHRHDRAPEWAAGLQCTALLGPYMYYRA